MELCTRNPSPGRPGARSSYLPTTLIGGSTLSAAVPCSRIATEHCSKDRIPCAALISWIFKAIFGSSGDPRISPSRYLSAQALSQVLETRERSRVSHPV
jgi:hypothetical protein